MLWAHCASKMAFCSLEPEWAAAATEVKEQTKGKVKLAAVDATVNQVLAGRYGVSVFTTHLLGEILKIFNSCLTPGFPSKQAGKCLSTCR